ncbi:MAG: hypothetical protein Q4F75_04605, partial [Pseudomonadota bacterium]|nr:hypothetical protein [Pseudomonadota bacterium]
HNNSFKINIFKWSWREAWLHKQKRPRRGDFNKWRAELVVGVNEPKAKFKPYETKGTHEVGIYILCNYRTNVNKDFQMLSGKIKVFKENLNQ